MKKLTLSSTLSLPDNVVAETFAFLAKRGAGKTYAAMVLAEEMLDVGAQIVVLDPVSKWWGLRLMAGGKAPAFDIPVLGGRHGDMPLSPRAGKVVATMVAEKRVSCVLDITLFQSDSERRTFVEDFARELFRLKSQQDDPSPLHVFLEEAEEFCLAADTELLTDKGWVRYEEIEADITKAVAFDLKTESYRYETVERKIVKQHDGEMVALKTKALDCLMTPEHRVVLRRLQRGSPERYHKYPWAFCSASDVPSNVGIPVGGAPEGAGVEGLSLEDARVLGWIMTDGYIHDRNAASIKIGLEQSIRTTKRGVRIADEMLAVLKSWDVSAYTRPARKNARLDGLGMMNSSPSVSFYFKETATARVLKWLGGDLPLKQERRLPRALMENCSKEQLFALWQGLLEGDGSTRKGAWSSFTPGRGEGLVDDFQELSLRIGIRTVKTWKGGSGQWSVSISPRSEHWVTRRPKRQPYRGNVWCITIPSGAFVARRNGRTFVTGNCPQDYEGGDARMIGAIKRLCKLGRNVGIGVSLVSQRSADINKKALSQTEYMIALRTRAPQDLQAIKGWIEHAGAAEAKAVLAELPTLPVGTAFVFGGDFAEKVVIRKKHTLDTSKTPDGGGGRKYEPGKLDAKDIAKLTAVMEESAADVEATDPKKLRERIAMLTRELKVAQGNAAAQLVEMRPAQPIKTKVVEVPVLKDAMIDRVLKVAAKLEEQTSRVIDEAAKLRMALAEASGTSKEALAAVRRPISMVEASRPANGRDLRVLPVAESVRRIVAREDAQHDLAVTKLPKGARDMLYALRSTFGTEGKPMTRTKLGFLAVIVATGGTFGDYLSKLRVAGLIQERDTQVWLTPEGATALGAALDDPPTPIGTLIDAWRQKGGMPKGARAMFDVLVDAGPEGLTREELGERAGVTASGGTFGDYLSKLRVKGLLDERDRGRVALSQDVWA